MFKQIFKKENGEVSLISSVISEETGQEVFDYDEVEYTDITPPSELYQPIYFRDGEWHGLTKEEWEQRQPDPEPIEPTESQIERGTMQMEVFKLQLMVQDLQEENASIIKELTDIKGGQ